MLRTSNPQRPTTAASQTSRDSRRGSLASSVGGKAPRKTTLRPPRDSGVLHFLTHAVTSVIDDSLFQRRGQKTRQEVASCAAEFLDNDCLAALPPENGHFLSQVCCVGGPRSLSKVSMASLLPAASAAPGDKVEGPRSSMQKSVRTSIGPRQSMKGGR